ncbi:hypothetical protein SELMODRAFT_404437 [Selaginella moellendorffii]|uniref:GHMP kinase C-terminal domain-containing protein n=1 Tax=Selaginella moellendorffii TaxID=88036 RepID=D8QVB7_SELML|nr:hypothetical protein SELMODRAFT_404437 [Selaginella moellendorffii]
MSLRNVADGSHTASHAFEILANNFGDKSDFFVSTCHIVCWEVTTSSSTIYCWTSLNTRASVPQGSGLGTSSILAAAVLEVRQGSTKSCQALLCHQSNKLAKLQRDGFVQHGDDNARGMANPPRTRSHVLVDAIFKKISHLSCGYKLVGAGGGGFAIVMAKEGDSAGIIREFLSSSFKDFELYSAVAMISATLHRLRLGVGESFVSRAEVFFELVR